MKYLVKANIKHDGQMLKVGSHVELDEKKAAPLLKDGLIELMGEMPKAQEPVLKQEYAPEVFEKPKSKGKGK